MGITPAGPGHNILEQAGTVTFDSEPTFVQSDSGGGNVRTRVVDEDEKVDLRFTFSVATEATVAAVLAFTKDHTFGTFAVKIPDPLGLGPIFFAELLEPPDIRRVNARTSHITVRVRRALLVDTG